MTRGRVRSGPRTLAARLLAAQSIVLVAGALTVGLVSALVGPPIFHQHLLESGHVEDSPELVHMEMAYGNASLISIGAGLLVSLVAAVGVTWLLTRRLRQTLDQLTAAARDLSRGHHATRVPVLGAGTELATLGAAVNTLAARLEGAEDTRRRMLADLAHELRTPIATLTAYHEGLHDGVIILGEESQAVLTEQTERLARLADDIHAVSLAQEGRLALDVHAHPVPAVLRAAEEEFRERYAAKGVRLVVATDDAADLRVSVDRRRIGQVMSNLLTNALRHTAPAGTVSLAARRTDDHIAITVTDDGDGMSEEQLNHAFERFYRGDAARTRDRGGTGIGLTISKAIVDAHGGFIAATSPGPGLGTTVTVALPLNRATVGRRTE